MTVPPEAAEFTIPIRDSTDVLRARGSARELAVRLKLGSADQTLSLIHI